MNFSKKLNEYIGLIECSAKDLADASGISPTVISRYRNGDRIPKYPSTQIENLIFGICKVAKEKNLILDRDIVEKDFLDSLNIKKIDFETFRQNLNLIISTLNINVADMSRFIGYDSSYLSKIRSGSRTPQNTIDFVDAVAKYITSNFTDENNLKIIASLISKEDIH